MKLVVARKVTSRVAKDLIIEFANKDTDLVATATQRGLLSTMTTETLETMVREIIAAHEGVAAEYKAGKVASLQFLLGQAMKATKGAADPNELRRLFEAVLRE
jgi:aspartyl-tRNA(Asn)/glutamyl-tRNA(Gln) amidotransferase subunit B